MDDITRSLEEARKLMNERMMLMRPNGIRSAEAERDYQRVKAETVLQLEAEGKSAKMIELIIKGLPEVNQKLFERDCAKAVYESNKEAVNVSKKELETILSVMKMEWYSNERD